jgi:catechol 2,3-dioxygenase-like lactoylglutathione lyase family enzyme
LRDVRKIITHFTSEQSGILWSMTGLLHYVDAVTFRVPDLDSGLAFYRDRLGHELLWRNDAEGQAGLRTPDSATEVVLTTTRSYEPNWKVHSAAEATAVFVANGGRILAGPDDIPIGQVVVVEDPFGNVLVLLDNTTGTYQTDAEGNVTGVA